MDPKLQTENVKYLTDETLSQTTIAIPRQANRQDYGPAVVVRGKVMMASGRHVTRKNTPRRARSTF